MVDHVEVWKSLPCHSGVRIKAELVIDGEGYLILFDDLLDLRNVSHVLAGANNDELLRLVRVPYLLGFREKLYAVPDGGTANLEPNFVFVFIMFLLSVLQ